MVKKRDKHWDSNSIKKNTPKIYTQYPDIGRIRNCNRLISTSKKQSPSNIHIFTSEQQVK